MKFDTIIIGGGLAGLTCGIRLSQQGQRCVIISSGQSALHFSSGSYDLLNTLPDGTEVTSPLSAIKSLTESYPNHPYAKLGEERFSELALFAQKYLQGIGVPVQGSAKENHYRVTPMGNLKSTWLSSADFATSQSKDKLPWKRVAIFNPIGFLDFYPRFIADEFLKLGTESNIHLFNLPDLDLLRRNPSEMRSTNIARVLDKKNNLSELTQLLKRESADCDAIIFPACLGLDDDTIEIIKKEVDKPFVLIPTLPPSIVGIHTQQYLHNFFIKSGGVYMLGDSVKRAEIDNNLVKRIYSYNHGDIPFTGKNVVLATGSYFSQGLIATQDSIYEPVFGLDTSYANNRQEWYRANMFDTQGYQSFGVKTNSSFNGLKNGRPIDNLYVAGAILEGFNGIKEGCGAGVSILSALHIADTILKNANH